MGKGLLATVVTAGCLMIAPVADAAPYLSMTKARSEARSMVRDLIADSNFYDGSVGKCFRKSSSTVDCRYVANHINGVDCHDKVRLRKYSTGFVMWLFPFKAQCY